MGEIHDGALNQAMSSARRPNDDGMAGYPAGGSACRKERNVVLGVVRSAGRLALGATQTAVAASPALVGLPRSPRRLVGEVVATGTQLTARAATEAVQVPARTVTAAADMARYGR